MKSPRRAAVGGLLAGVMLLGACSADNESESATTVPRAQGGALHGMFIQRQLDEYVKTSDVIIVGEVVDKEKRKDKREGAWKGSTWEYVSVRVQETIVGETSESLTVRRLVEAKRFQLSGDVFAGELEAGNRYLMVLIPAKSGEYYRIRGEQGIATITGDIVQFPDGGILVGDRTSTLAEIREMAPN